ncbi:hypothetical protein KUTeg_005841 [Tegillarca granosa]|uniref:Uncharacterized protein n=1 Tax=Tegillarca granosa TaxID=220873 RepID=A0ABQ9FJ75_TEGGR|nr:hypothetical protein KUTeg_005841 [Tegillarca granosa]
MNYYFLVNFVTLLLTWFFAWSVQVARPRLHTDTDYLSVSYGTKSRRSRSEKPNIIVILTDDQDELLGSMHVMPKTLRIMRDQGVHFNNSFVSTPMCCPSRSSFLTGMYTHNHHVYTNNDNCSSLYWQRTHETRSFSTYLSNVGYRTGYFGKYLNEYNGTYIPPGWREWVGLIRNSRFYNYSINFNGQKIKKGDNYYADYFTDLIANDSVTFLKQSKQYFPRRPVLMVLSAPAPHGPEDSAPQYQHLFYNNTFHRTPTWNMAPNLDKQYLLKITDKMEPIEQKFTDVLAQKRLQTLQSVDDLVEKVYNELRDLGELDNTYILYTSDHGYHLGQFGLAKGKALPYDFDVRVPLYIRGPGIRGRSKISNIALNIDIAPTILDMAGVETPEQMDGRSLLKLIKAYRDSSNVDELNFVQTRKPWRETVLLERGECAKPENKAPCKEGQVCSKSAKSVPSLCKVGQKYHCVYEQGRTLPRLQKCRSKNMYDIPLQKDNPSKKRCLCRPQNDGINPMEKKVQRKFLRTYANKEFRPKFIRSKRSSYVDMFKNQNQATSDYYNNASEYKNQNQATSDYYNNARITPFDRRCRELPNNTISCDQQLYQDATAWKDHKDKLDEMITEYRKMLEDLRMYRKHLKKVKPKESFLQDYDADINQLFSTDNVNRIESVGTTEPCDCEDDYDIDFKK